MSAPHKPIIMSDSPDTTVGELLDYLSQFDPQDRVVLTLKDAGVDSDCVCLDVAMTLLAERFPACPECGSYGKQGNGDTIIQCTGCGYFFKGEGQ